MKRLLLALALIVPLIPPAAAAHAEPSKIDSGISADAADVWVTFHGKADLSKAAAISDWAERGRAVVQTLQATAERSQRGVRQKLAQQGLTYQSFWATNAILVRSADVSTRRALAARAEVARIRAPQRIQIEMPDTATAPGTLGQPEWGVAAVSAPEVWQQYGRGEGIVVGSIDTGAQSDHPALAQQYRGRNADGSVSHDYNWFDPARICSGNGALPCDNSGHGTHTIGTMVGDDGAGNQIGVAPAAKWIAAKGCESNGCTEGSLIAAGQWMLAPTTTDGANPRPELRPHVINNSWGSPSTTGFYRDVVQAWLAAGVFPVFSAGNSGPGCWTHGEPGSLPEAYAVAAYDSAGQIASFSSRGPSTQTDDIKPDIAAPGVAVRSSLPNDSYGANSGTSMAAPHAAGVVALLLSLAPLLVGDAAEIRAILDASASDVDDQTCGGTASDNHVWGQGKIDALAAALRAPVGPQGTLTGIVTDTQGNPLPGATVAVQIGSRSLTAAADAAGRYNLLRVPVGAHTFTARAFGYGSASRQATIVVDGTARLDFTLATVPRFPVTGTAHDDRGRVLAGAEVRLAGTPLAPATTDADGRFAFPSVPVGDHTAVGRGDACLATGSAPFTVDGPESVALTVPRRSDGFGYTCTVGNGQWIPGVVRTGVTGPVFGERVELPFPMPYYGRDYHWVAVAVNGFASFDGLLGSVDPSDWFRFPYAIPNPGFPTAVMQVFWDDLTVDGSAGVYTATVGQAPHRTFVIEWRNVLVGADGVDRRSSFEMLLHEDGRITYQYDSIDTSRERGSGAGIGIENADGTDGLQFTIRRESLRSGMAITFDPGRNALVSGKITDRNDGQPLASARVELRRGEAVVSSATTDTLGGYLLHATPGQYTLRVSASNYTAFEAPVSLVDNARLPKDAALETGVASITAAPIEPVLAAGQTRQQAVRITNTGSRPLSWQALESAAPPQEYPGQVLGSWPASGVDQPYGIGLTPTSVWVSDAAVNRVVEYDRAGRPTGRAWQLDWLTPSTEIGDMAFDSRRGVMCQTVRGGDGQGYGAGITCWNPETGAFAGHTTVDMLDIQPRGLAYRPDDDTFYVSDWRLVTLARIAGFSHPQPGKMLSSCIHDEYPGGLAWSPGTKRLWMANNQLVTDTIVEVDPVDCRISRRLPNPNPPYNGGGLDMSDDGSLWTVGRRDKSVHRVATGQPAPAELPWLSLGATSGTLAPGQSTVLQIGVSADGLATGRNAGSVLLRTDAGRVPTRQVAVSPTLTGYRVAIDAGGNGHTATVDGEQWLPDRLFTPSSTASTRAGIAGTEDDGLFQTARTGAFKYQFNSLPDGRYLVEVGFAEIEGKRPGKRLFDVYAGDARMAYAIDLAGEFGANTAGWRTAIVTVSGGTLVLDFVPRDRAGQPIVNALRITHLPA
ncbi:S8 family serine peptidase [Allorhizocola rhizosphaerae]|uniref:S8 family serine peptidase n=1 Tax=Allorhizocola rhizosphaerae TaxID=1872709 RepID=UPI000E3D62D1|nr:S8 family serine peptidase [Allorhizocola rhizosphaerae]